MCAHSLQGTSGKRQKRVWWGGPGQAVALIKVFVASDPLVAILRNLESPRCFQLLIVVTVTPSAVAACW